MSAVREIVRRRGLRIDDPAAQKTTLRSVTHQVKDLAKDASAQGDFGRAGVLAHDHPPAGDQAHF
eukprot:11194282-Lingulodinium_polyedra.AAC.1